MLADPFPPNGGNPVVSAPTIHLPEPPAAAAAPPPASTTVQDSIPSTTEANNVQPNTLPINGLDISHVYRMKIHSTNTSIVANLIILPLPTKPTTHHYCLSVRNNFQFSLRLKSFLPCPHLQKADLLCQPRQITSQ